MEASTKALRAQLDQAMADLSEAATLDEINQTLVDMLEAIKARKPEIHIDVAPTPVLVRVQPAPVTVQVVRSGGFEHTFSYDKHDRLVGGRSVPIPSTQGN